MAIKEGDFIEIEYTGRLADGEKECFDTTSEEVAKKEGIYSSKTKYGPVKIIVGEHHVIPGIDRNLIGKEVGKFRFNIADVEAFGKKSAKLLQLVPAKLFSKENIKPYPGLQVNIDDQMGVIKNVSGGRIIVDFNHPLASKDVIYDIEIKRIITGAKEKIETLFAMIGLKAEEIKVENDSAKIITKVPLPEQLITALENDLKKFTGLKTIKFEVLKTESKPADNKDKK